MSPCHLVTLSRCDECAMLIAGGVGIGLVSGCLAARLLYRAPWMSFVRLLLGVLVQGALILKLSSPQVVIWFISALLISALVCVAARRALEARYGSARKEWS